MTVDVRSINALQEFQHRLDRYCAMPKAPIESIMRDAQRTMQQLEDRLQFFLRERERALAQEEEAQRNLERCRRFSSSRSNRSGDCDLEEHLYRSAQQHRRKIEECINQVRRLIAMLEHELISARRDAHALLSALDRQGRSGVQFLESSVAILMSYADMAVPQSLPDIDLGFGAVINTVQDTASATVSAAQQTAENTGTATIDAILGD
jgi:hypothetical protein